MEPEYSLGDITSIQIINKTTGDIVAEFDYSTARVEHYHDENLKLVETNINLDSDSNQE